MRRLDPYRLVVLGGFGFDNLGDDLILRSALAQFRRVLGNVEITVLSNNPYETASRHGGEVIVFSGSTLSSGHPEDLVACIEVPSEVSSSDTQRQFRLLVDLSVEIRLGREPWRRLP